MRLKLLATLIVLFLCLMIITSCSPSDTTPGENIPYPDIERIKLSDAYDAFANESAIFLDVRNPAELTQGSIPGSVNIPVNELSEHLVDLDPEASYITLCT